MAEHIPFCIAEKLVQKLGSDAFQEIGLIYGVKNDLKKLEDSLSTIKAVLLDAEEKQESNHAVENWIKRLKEIVYEADELLDEIATEHLRRKVRGGKMARKVHDFFSSSNQIWFRRKVGHRIKDIREKLNEVKNDISIVNLVKKEIVGDVRDKNSPRETDSYVVQSEIIGREGDKENIITSLLDVASQESVSVVAVVGFGGLGKTTLAQLVYNDEKVVNYFDKKMWVCVSEDFDVKLLIKKILQCLTDNEEPNLELQQLQSRLREILEGKRYLLVFDDVWNEDMQLWDCLKKYLSVGGRGSKILVTTRNRTVASIMGVDSPYDLKGLTDDQAWDLFEKLAFGQGHNMVNPKLVEIGQGIVKKCKGVPLAIRSLGSLMHLKTKESDWSSILEDDLWSSFQSRGNIFPVLKLSYHHLPIYLRQCFAYCAMFPKDYEFDKEILIYLWMAQGYIVPLHNNESLEDIGEQYFNELLYRSFFHLSESQYSETCYKMHDLIHDLAKLIAKDSCIVLENNMESVSERVHHIYYSEVLSFGEIQKLIKVQGMRTLFVLYVGDYMQFEKIASNFQSLLALHLTSYLALEHRPLTFQIGKLKYLRYLNFSDCSITELPNSITNLLNLQTLILSNCWCLIELPRDIKKLVSLRCLMIDECPNVKCMPIGLGKLTCLHELSRFVVAHVEDDECSCSMVSTRSGKGMLNELNGLNQLRGKIEIERLDNVKNVELEAKEVNLRLKKHLKSLRLKWRYRGRESENDELLLKELEPHPNLQELYVEYFKGVRFSSWLPNITNLVNLTLTDCVKLKHLPPLHRLPYLETLHLSYLHSLEYISDDDRPSTSELAPSIPFFPSLQDLDLRYCLNLKGWWSGVENENEMPQFPCLSRLNIEYCKNLTWMPSSLHQVLLSDVPVRLLHEMMATSSSFQLLTLRNILSLESLPEEWLQNLTSLQKVEIIYCPVLASIYQGMRHLTCLQNLRISSCCELIIDGDDDNGMEWGGLRSLRSLSFEFLPEMISLPKGLQFVTTLQQLSISSCPKFTALPDWIGNLISLQRLELVSCKNLMSLPQGMHKLTSLQELRIKNCIRLSETCMKERGIDWPKISHIPNVVIKNYQAC